MKPFLESPALPHYVQELREVLAREHSLRQRFYDHAAHGVGEYWLVDPQREQVERFVLKARRYAASGMLRRGQISSKVIAGFEVPVGALFQREANLRALRRLLA